MPTQRAISRRAHRLLLLPCLASLALLGTTAPAQAALTTDADHTNAAIACSMKGQSDDTGTYYAACGTKIARTDKNGVRLADIALPAGVAQPKDLAPSPDGTYLYLTQGTGTPVRLNRQANGTYAKDAKWLLAPFTYGGKTWKPIGHFIETDGRGDIYLSNGSYWISDSVPTPAAIVKYAPSGTVVTGFGDYGTTPGLWAANQDVAVTRDGRRVYVGENCGVQCISSKPNYQPSRVTRYDYVAGGNYRFTRIISAQGAPGAGALGCPAAGAVHSAYSLGMDAFDNLYATSTSCGFLQMFDTDPVPANDRFVGTVAKNLDAKGAGVHNHVLASDWSGRLYAAEWLKVITPKVAKLPALPLPALAPLPGPDTKAPTLTNVVVPATSPTRDITVQITATDDVAVAEYQIANEDGNFGPWQPIAAQVKHTLTANYGPKGITVRVRDMAGNESGTVYKATAWIDPNAPAGGGGGAPAPAPAPGGAVDKAVPVIAKIAVPATTGTRDITVNLTATDDIGVTGVRFANEDGEWGAWGAFAAAKTWTLTPGYTNKLVIAQVRDAVGNESTTVSAPTRLMADAPPPPPAGAAPDAVAPVLSAVTLPAETTTQAVTVTLKATDAIGVAQVRFANEDGNWTPWQAFAPQKAWNLTAGFGNKLVFAQVRDAALNESLSLYAPTRYVQTVAGPVDKAPPALTAITLPNPTATRTVTVALTATDDVGVTEVRFANEDGTWGPWVAYGNGQVTHTLTVGATYKVVFAQVRDRAGQESNTMTATTLVTP